MVKMTSTSNSTTLQKRISVLARFWVHIPQVIRQIEPHLSISQKKQLKKEGQYKGQQEEFPTHLDPNAVPSCAGLVSQFIIGAIDPGKKHKPFVMRYCEEVLKNLHNLETLDTSELTESMAESLAKLKKLKSLRLSPYLTSISPEAVIPLAKLGNLEHICLEDRSLGTITPTNEKVVQKMLLNSLPTLKSLEVRPRKDYSNFLQDWENQVKARGPSALKQEHDFTALKSLSLYWINFNGKFGEKVIPNLTRAVDFLKLRELKLMHLGEGQLAFFKSLQDLFRKADKHDIHLRKLCLDMRGPGDKSSNAETEIFLEGLYGFISSFDSLTSLEIHEYNKYKKSTESNPGLSRRLLQSVLKHPELVTLRFHYENVISEQYQVPFVPPETVKILVDNLPRLRIFEFSPQDDNLYAMTRALSRAKNLTTLICSHYPSRHQDKKNFPLSFAKSMIEGFMKNASSGENFRWEEHYKLNRLTVGRKKYSIASDLKPKKGFEKPVKISVGNRKVMMQDLQETLDKKKWNAKFSESYHVPDSKWVDYVEREIGPEGP